MKINSDNSSHIFYIVTTILCALLVIHIIEKQIVEKITEYKLENKYVNTVYYDKIFYHLNASKIICYIILFTVFILLVNPFKLIKIFNPNIFSLNNNYESIIKYVNDNDDLCNFNVHTYKTKKPHETVYLDKTQQEYVLSVNENRVYERIKNDFGDEKLLCDTINSLKIDNELNKLDFKTFRKYYPPLDDTIKDEEGNDITIKSDVHEHL